MKKILKTACLLAGLTAASLSPAPANAHNVSSNVRKWIPSSANIDTTSGHIVSSFCDGKYEDVASGLQSFGVNDSIHFYRLSAGLPKLEVKSDGLRYGRHTRRETRLKDALRLMDRSQTHLSPEAIGDYFMTLNVNVHAGKDWWIKAEENVQVDKEQGCTIWLYNNWNGNPCRHYYRQGPSASAAIARENTAFDWLMTGHQLENVRQNWLGYARLNKDSIANIFEHIDAQSLKRPGVNIWMAQYHHHKLFEHKVPPEIAARAQDAVSRIMNCQATPAEYGIIAVGDLGLPREYLPKILAETRTRRDIHTLTYKAITEGEGLNVAYHSQLRVLADQLEDKSWAGHFLFLSAPDVATAVQIYQDSLLQEKGPYWYLGYYGYSTGVKTLIFGLPTEAIPHDLMQFGHALSENKLDLVTSLEDEAFSAARAMRLSALAGAQKAVDLYQQRPGLIARTEKAKRKLDLETAKLAQIESLKSSDLPIQVRASLLAILAEVSHNYDRHNRKHTRNIHPEQSSSEFLDVYVRHKLFPGIIFLPRIRGYLPHQHPRLYLGTGNYRTEVPAIPPLRKNDGSPEAGLAALIDWEKLEAFADDKKLTRTMAVNIMEWLDTASAEDRRANAELIAPALYAIIRIARYEDAGLYEGAPVQKRVHEYLHKYYGQTLSAKKTPYWWKTSRRRGHVPF